MIDTIAQTLFLIVIFSAIIVLVAVMYVAIQIMIEVLEAVWIEWKIRRGRE